MGGTSEVGHEGECRGRTGWDNDDEALEELEGEELGGEPVAGAGIGGVVTEKRDNGKPIGDNNSSSFGVSSGEAISFESVPS